MNAFRHLSFALILFASYLTSCSNSTTHDSNLSEGVAVVYGQDDRSEMHFSNSNFSNQARATVALINQQELRPLKSKFFYVNSDIYGKSHNMCSEERFFNQKNPVSCTGTLITPTRVLTAGHCVIDDAVCKNFRYIFDYDTNSTFSGHFIHQRKVFFCKQLLRRTFDFEGIDFAIIELDRPVTDRAALIAGNSDDVLLNSKVTVLGFPAGLAMKQISNGKIRSVDKELFTASIDAYTGTSGAPVFSQHDGRFIGMLVRGANDYRYDSKRKCNISNICSENKCRGEDIIPINLLKDFFFEAKGPNKEILPEWEF